MKEHEIRREDEGITLEVHSASLRWTKGWTKGVRPSMPLAQQWNLRTFGQTQTDGNPLVCPYVEQGTVLEDMSTEASPPKHQLTHNHHAGAHHAMACTHWHARDRARPRSRTCTPQLLLPPARLLPAACSAKNCSSGSGRRSAGFRHSGVAGCDVAGCVLAAPVAAATATMSMLSSAL